MGKRGPTPERSELRIRRNAPSDGIEVSKGTARGFKRWPNADPSWSASVKRFYKTFSQSGMADYYEETDLEMIWQACDELEYHRRGGKRSAMHFDTLMKHFAAFGATEDGRRRMRIELESQSTGSEHDAEYELAEALRDMSIVVRK